MATLYNNDAKFDYLELHRHWDPMSERYAGADALLTAMNKGWKPAQTVHFEEYWHAGSRLVTIYHFDLTRGDEQMTMPVLSNPFARRILKRVATDVVSIDERGLTRRAASNESRAN